MSLAALADEVASRLLVCNLPFGISKSGNLTLNGKLLTGGAKAYRKLAQAAGPDFQEWAAKQPDTARLVFDMGDFGDRLLAALQVKVPRVEEAKPTYNPDEVFSDAVPYPVSKLTFIHNLEALNKSVLWYEEADKVLEFGYSSLEIWLERRLGKKGFEAWACEHSLTSYIGYEPWKPRIISGDIPPTFNTWNPAPWEAGWTPPTAKADCPAELGEFLAAMFADEESRYHCQTWLRDATFSRAWPVLVLAGTPGTGKNIFVENLTAGLVGVKNYKLAHRKFASATFDDAVIGCRLFFQDEIALTPEVRDACKALHNTQATVQEKFVSVGRQKNVHASLVIANNELSKIKLEYSDRKFYVPTLSTLPLKSAWSAEKITRFVGLLADDSYLRKVADYLHSNFKAGASEQFPKTPLFKRLCINSYPPFYRAFIDHCTLKPIVKAKDVNRNIKTPPNRNELQDFLDHYRINFGEELATVKDGAVGMQWEAISKVYKGPTEDENI